MVEASRNAKRMEGLHETSVYKAMLTLEHFARLAGPCSSKHVTQQTLDQFILERSQEVKKDTLNKDIRNINTFLGWAVQNRYLGSDLQVKKVKVPQKPAAALSSQLADDVHANVDPVLRSQLPVADWL